MKKVLLLVSLALISVIALNAQKVWNLGGDATLASTSPAFPLSSGIGIGDGSAGNPAFPVMIDGLGITGFSGNANMGAVNASSKPFGSYSFPNRFQLNGAGYSGANAADASPSVNMPTQRYLSFNVSGNSTIYVIGITGSASSERKLFVTDGTNFVGSVTFPAGSALNDGTIEYTGGAATLYVFGNSPINLTLLSATNYITSSVKPAFSDKGLSYNGKQILNNKNLNVELYDVLGKLVATSNNNINTTDLAKGIYMVRAEGINSAMKINVQ